MASSLPRYAYRTHQGHMLDLSEPEAISFDLQDIAHHLARICRFGGAVDGYYSVASHCVYVATELEREGYRRSIVQAGLLHDAAEAYIGDMVSGLKRLMPEYRRLEDRYTAAIEHQFSVTFHGSRIIKTADLRARLSECRDLFEDYPRELLLGGEDGLEPYATRVAPQPPDEAEWAFMHTARRLGLYP